MSYLLYVSFHRIFASPSKFNVGYVTCTNHGRILIAVQTIAGWSTGALDFPTNKKDYLFKIQAASKVYGVNMPNQTEYLDRFISMLRVYE